MNRVWSHAIVAAILALSSVGISATAGQNTTSQPGGLQIFAERVAAYADLHQRVDAVFPPWTATNDVASIFGRRAYLAVAINAERPEAKQGDIFEPSAANALRGIVANALSGTGWPLLDLT